MRSIGSLYSNIGLIMKGTGAYYEETNPDIIAASANQNGIILRSLTLASEGAIGCSIWVGGKRIMYTDYVAYIDMREAIIMPPGASLGIGITRGVYLTLSYDRLPA